MSFFRAKIPQRRTGRLLLEDLGDRDLRERRLDPREVVRQFEVAALVPGDAPDCLHMTLTELTDHIEATHHAYLRRELPRLTAMTT